VRLQAAYEKFRDRADFYWIYIREEYPIESPSPASHVKISQPKTWLQRSEVAGQCSQDLNLTLPLLVDDISDTAAQTFEAIPDRLYILAPDGTIAYQGPPGPKEFDADGMVRVLEQLLQTK